MLTVSGAVFLYKREIWHAAAADHRSAPPAKFHVYQYNVPPLQGEKPIFGPLSKTKYRHATLWAGLLVINV